VIEPRPIAFYHDAMGVDGRLVVAYSTTSGEAPSSLVKHEDVTRTFALTDLAATAPAPIPAVEPLPRKLWVAPIWSHGRYGDTDDHVGNAIWCVTEDAERLTAHGFPLITTGPVDAARDLTVAYWCSGAHRDDLGARVREALTWPEKPVIAYLDQDGWPDPKPSWVTERVWPSIMAYRNAGESLSAFDARLTAILRRVRGYDRPMFLTPAFYTRNGAVPVSDILACMPLYDRWMREFEIVGFMPFADRRPTGMLQHPEFRVWARAFLAASVRPTRHDYWTSDGPATEPMHPRVTRKLRQRESLTGEECDWLLSRLSAN